MEKVFFKAELRFYEDQLAIGLIRVSGRRLNGAYKIVAGIGDLQGDSYKLVAKRRRLEIRRNFFSRRVSLKQQLRASSRDVIL